jgi:broad specificity phosphatase PhoE
MQKSFITLIFVRHCRSYHNMVHDEDDGDKDHSEDPLYEDALVISYNNCSINYDVKYTALYSSSARRCIQTINHIVNNSEIIIDDRLLEYGSEVCNKRKPKNEIISFIKSELEENCNTFNTDKALDSYIFDEHQTKTKLIKRTENFILEIATKYKAGMSY